MIIKRYSLKPRVLEILLVCSLVSFLRQQVQIAAAEDNECPTKDPHIFFEEVETAASPRPGAADALATGNLVVSLGEVFFNSQKFAGTSYPAIKDFGFGPGGAMFPWFETDGSDAVLFSADGTSTRFIPSGSVYKSERAGAGDLRIVTSNSGNGWIITEPGGSKTVFSRIIARSGEVLPTETVSRLGETTTISYFDNSFLPKEITGPNGLKVTFEDRGTSIVMRDPDGSTLTYVKDSLGRIKEVVYPDGKKDSIAWDCLKNKYYLIVSIIDRDGIPISYTYNVRKDGENRHGILRTVATTIDARLFRYATDKTTIEVAESEATFKENPDGSRSYDPMGFAEYRFGRNKFGPYVTALLEGSSPSSNLSLTGEVVQDSEGRVTQTTNSLGLVTKLSYSNAPFPDRVVHHDGTFVEYQRDPAIAYAPKYIGVYSRENDLIYSQTISWAGVDLPTQFLGGPAEDQGASAVRIQYSGKLPSRVVETKRSRITWNNQGFPVALSSDAGSALLTYTADGDISSIDEGADPLFISRDVRPDGLIKTKTKSPWFELERETTLSGTTTQRFTLTGSGGLARYNFSPISSIRGEDSQTAKPATTTKIEERSACGAGNEDSTCTVTDSDGKTRSCAGLLKCTENGEGQTCTNVTTEDGGPNPAKKANCTKNGAVPKTGESCCEGAPCPTQGGKCRTSEQCCAPLGTKPATTGQPCCDGAASCATKGGVCLAPANCPACPDGQVQCPSGECIAKAKQSLCKCPTGQVKCGDECVTKGQCCSSPKKFCPATKVCFDPSKASCCGDGICQKGEPGKCDKDCCGKEGGSPNPGCCSGLKICGDKCVNQSSQCCSKAGEQVIGNKQCCGGQNPSLAVYPSIDQICRNCAPLGQAPKGHGCCTPSNATSLLEAEPINGLCTKCLEEGGISVSDPCCGSLKKYGDSCQSCAKGNQSPVAGQQCCPNQNLLLEGGVCRPCTPDGQAPLSGQKCCTATSGLIQGKCGWCIGEGLKQQAFIAGPPCCDGLQPNSEKICTKTSNGGGGPSSCINVGKSCTKGGSPTCCNGGDAKCKQITVQGQPMFQCQ